MTHKLRPPKTQAEAEARRCYSCNKKGSETILLTIILPPTVMERQDLCPACLAIAIDDSKKKGKATQ